MKILADENIALVEACFAPLGELVIMPGRAMTSAHLQDVDALLVRSVTRVDQKLLADSPCRYIATATSGIDHVDTAVLAQRGIEFQAARGCNAMAVADYVIAALACLAVDTGLAWRRGRIGIVGCGQVGSNLATRLLAAGVEVLIHDPFLPQTHPLAARFRPLEEVLGADIVTLHTPLTSSGRWPTRHMLSAAMLDCINSGSVLINTARGDVIDEAALLERMARRADLHLVLDAWAGEPAINEAMRKRVFLGTPHIAGYSRAGKVRGTAMVLEGLCRHFGLAMPSVNLDMPRTELAWTEAQDVDRFILQAYDIRQDHQALACAMTEAEPARGFDRLRREYPERMEFGQIRPRGEASPAASRLLAALGFDIASG